jgi:hypothetical protein
VSFDKATPGGAQYAARAGALVLVLAGGYALHRTVPDTGKVKDSVRDAHTSLLAYLVRGRCIAALGAMLSAALPAPTARALCLPCCARGPARAHQSPPAPLSPIPPDPQETLSAKGAITGGNDTGSAAGGRAGAGARGGPGAGARYEDLGRRRQQQREEWARAHQQQQERAQQDRDVKVEEKDMEEEEGGEHEEPAKQGAGDKAKTEL